MPHSGDGVDQAVEQVRIRSLAERRVDGGGVIRETAAAGLIRPSRA